MRRFKTSQVCVQQIARPIPVRLYNYAPLQQLCIDVPGAGPWIVVCQEREELSGARVWKVQPIRPDNLKWRGEELPFTSPADAPAPNVFTGCHTARSAEERDAEVARVCALLVAPLYPSREVRG